MFRNIVVTGGAGFVGSHVAIALRDRYAGCAVLAMDNLRRRGSELNVRRLRNRGVQFVHGDVRNAEDLEAIGAADLVVDAAAEPSVLAGTESGPEYVIQTNLLGTVNCLEFARRRGAAVIFLSTSRVYPYEALNAIPYREEPTRFTPECVGTAGLTDRGVSETFPLEGPRSFYGATKLCSEYLIAEYVATYGLRAVTNRCGVLTGPWQMGKTDQGFVVHWVARHILQEPLHYIGFGGTGKQVRDVLHIDDLVRLIGLQAESMDRVTGQIFNVGGGVARSTSLLELTDLCRQVTGKSVPIEPTMSTRPADVRWYVSDIGKITRCTGWEPRVDLGTTIDQISRWITDNLDSLASVFDSPSP